MGIAQGALASASTMHVHSPLKTLEQKSKQQKDNWITFQTLRIFKIFRTFNEKTLFVFHKDLREDFGPISF